MGANGIALPLNKHYFPPDYPPDDRRGGGASLRRGGACCFPRLRSAPEFLVCSMFRPIAFLFCTLFQLAICVPPEVLACLRQERAANENPSQNVISVFSQQPAYLHCKTPKGTGHVVAWTRAADQALLTAGSQSFTSDPRFQVSRKTDEDWILILRRADVSDSGCYLCEVNTEPLSSVYAIYLDVKEAPTPSPSNSKKSTKLMANMNGDEVLLNCTVALGDSAEDDVIWTRDGKTINLNDTEKYVWKVKRAAGVIVHTVRIRSATMEDDGDYACQNKNQIANQIVHVNRAEAQRSSASLSSFLLVSGLLPSLFL